MGKVIPAVGTLVRPSTGDILYRVVEAHEHGCRVEAIMSEVVDVAGRQPRKLRYNEKCFSLAVCRNTGMLFDGGWRGWTVVK